MSSSSCLYTKEFLHLPESSAGYIEHHADVSAMPIAHRHDELELNLVTAGSATYLLQGRRYELRCNTLVWLFPRQEHSLLDKSRRFDYWLGLFRPELVRTACTSNRTQPLLADNPDGRYCRDLSEKSASELIDVFGVASNATDIATKTAGLSFALLTAWEAFGRGEEALATRAVHPCVEMAVLMIRDEIDPIPLGTMAQELGLSAPYLSELFKQQTGLTLSQYRNRQRLRRFLEIDERRQHKSMLSAALQAGFGSYPQFYRVFLALMGCSPAEYRSRRLERSVHEPGWLSGRAIRR